MTVHIDQPPHDDWIKQVSNDADLDWSSADEPMTPERLKAEARRIADEAHPTP